MVDAAVDFVQRAQRAWTAAMTFGNLANVTGIDQAQIARDFGSKDALIDAVVDSIFTTQANETYIENNSFWMDRIAHDLDTPLSEIMEQIGGYFEQYIAEDFDQSVAYLALWSCADLGSAEWRALGRVHTHLLERSGELMDGCIAALVERGAVRRDYFTPTEFITLVDATIEGVLIRWSTAPELVPPGLLGKAIVALMTGIVGPDAETPMAQLARMPRPSGDG